MFFTNCNTVLNGWRRQVSTGFQEMFYLVKYPGITDRCTADHDTINAVFVFVFQCFFGTVNITVTKNGDLDPWIVLHFTDQFPISMALIHLGPRSSVYRQCFYANIL